MLDALLIYTLDDLGWKFHATLNDPQFALFRNSLALAQGRR
jgi:hypothetical protein